MTERCRDCKRPLKNPSPTGYGPDCARKHGLTPTKPRRTRAPQRRPAPVPPAPDTIPVIPGQLEIPLEGTR